MEIYNLKEYSKVYVLGGLDTDFRRLINTIQNQSATKDQEEKHFAMLQAAISNFQKKKRINKLNNTLNNSVIIITGDCGIGSEEGNNTFQTLNNLLVDINAHLFFVRGNHDNPSYFNGKVCFSNLKAIKDYSIIMTENDNILCVGGAVSVDRGWRITKESYISPFGNNSEKKLYWKEEEPYFDEESLNEIVSNNIDINFVITHSAPSFVPLDKNSKANAWIALDHSLKDDIAKERKTLDNIYDFLIGHKMGLKGWFFGHFDISFNYKSDEYVAFVSLKNDSKLVNIYKGVDFACNIETKKPQSFSSLLHNGLHGMNFELPHYEPRQQRHPYQVQIGREGLLGANQDMLRGIRGEDRLNGALEDLGEGEFAVDDNHNAYGMAAPNLGVLRG